MKEGYERVKYGIKKDIRKCSLLWGEGRQSGSVKRKNRHRGMQMAASGSICKGRNICAARTVDSIAWKPTPEPSSFLSCKRRGLREGLEKAKNKARRRLFEFSAEERPHIDASTAAPAFRIGNFISKLYRYGDVDRDSKTCVTISHRPVIPPPPHFSRRSLILSMKRAESRLWRSRNINSDWVEIDVILKQCTFLRQGKKKFMEKRPFNPLMYITACRKI